MTLSEFNEALKATEGKELGRFVQKHIFHGVPVVFDGREDDYFDFRNDIATHFGIGYHEVFIVGSAKQGFSYHQERDTFTLDSDIDVAIVSEVLYERFRIIVRDFQYRLSANLISINDKQEKSYRLFLKWLAKGWVRPELAPFIFDNEQEGWTKYFLSISNGKSGVGNYEVHAGVFKSYDDLETYHTQGVYNHYRKITVADEESGK